MAAKPDHHAGVDLDRDLELRAMSTEQLHRYGLSAIWCHTPIKHLPVNKGIETVFKILEERKALDDVA